MLVNCFGKLKCWNFRKNYAFVFFACLSCEARCTSHAVNMTVCQLQVPNKKGRKQYVKSVILSKSDRIHINWMKLKCFTALPWKIRVKVTLTDIFIITRSCDSGFFFSKVAIKNNMRFVGVFKIMIRFNEEKVCVELMAGVVLCGMLESHSLLETIL